MIIALHWAEWLRRVEVDRFDAKSSVEVEDFLQDELPADRTAFVFDDTDRPMVQCLASQWGQGRYSKKQLVEIHNALSAEANHVRNFKDVDAGLTQIAFRLVQLGKEALPRKLTRSNMEQQHEHHEHKPETTTEQQPADGAAAAAAAQAQAESPAEAKKAAAARKAEEKAAAKKAAEEKKAADKKAKEEEAARKKAEAAANKPVGVIGTLMNLLGEKDHHGKPVKRTVDELFDILLKQFPERGEGMKTTVRVQLVRLTKEGRMTVHSEDRVDAEGKKLAGKNYWGEAIPKAAA